MISTAPLARLRDRLEQARLRRALRRLWAKAAAATPPPPGAATLSLLCRLDAPDPQRLAALLASVTVARPQDGGVELLLIDERGDVRDEPRGVHGGIARRWLRGPGAAARALAQAAGDWIAVADQDDALAPHALDRVRAALAGAPQARLLYTDMLETDTALRPVALVARPAFDPLLWKACDYVGPLIVMRRDLATALGPLPDIAGNADFRRALARALIGAPPTAIAHLPYPACLRRAPGCAPAAPPARRRPGPPAAARGAVRVSAVVPNRDSPALIERALSDLLDGVAYPEIEVIVVDNGSVDPRTLRLYEARRADPRFRLEMRPAPFNFARMVNQGAALARGDALLLFNNDVCAQEPDWLAEMVDCLKPSDVGVVGARLLYPDGRLQHAGVVVGMKGAADHWFRGAPGDAAGPLGRLHARGAVTAVTAACMLTSLRCWRALDGMDAGAFAIAYNDVDYCLRARARDYAVIWTPFATLTHHEKASRGDPWPFGAQARARHAEREALRRRHGAARFDDPVFSPLWDRDARIPRIAADPPLAGTRHFMASPVAEADI